MINRRAFLKVTAVAAIGGAMGMTGRVHAQGVEPLALKGYDPVAYFTDAKPTPGLEQFELLWDGQRYRFANALHREMFKTSPDKYAPQFGGLCAMNLSNGVRRESDPHNWVISNGSLYVFAGERGMQNFTKAPAEIAARAAAHLRAQKASATQ
ncbi:MAG: twin-arginine translocation signal domain-containing protein [Enhydrobacter sp.]|nr:twin-arginine translocation signal domain-containing protein [Enhydrobacter sp.]